MTSSDIPHELPITKVTLLPPAAAADMSLSEKSTLESCFPSMHMAIRYPRHSLSIAFPSVSSAFCISLGEALSESFDSFNYLTLILQYLLSLFMYSPQASFRYCSFKFPTATIFTFIIRTPRLRRQFLPGLPSICNPCLF